MLEPRWEQDRPTCADDAAKIQALWEAVSIEAAVTDEALPAESLVAALRKTHVNGGALFAAFRLGPNADFDWFMSRNRWGEIEFPERFFRAEEVTNALPDLCDAVVDDAFGFEWGSAYTFAGEIAETLARGGAYKKHEAGSNDAVSFAERFQKWLYADRFDEVLVMKSFKAWSGWFFDIAWDSTWIVVDKRNRTASVFAVTDTD